MVADSVSDECGTRTSLGDVRILKLTRRRPMDSQMKQQIRMSFERIDELLLCGIFQRERADDPLVMSALAERLILVRDPMAKAKKFTTPVQLTDDLNIANQVKDVSDAIKYVRDGICHVDSENHSHDLCKARIGYNVAYGKRCIAKFGDVELTSDYEDDVCFFGEQKLYLKRLLRRAYQEAKDKLSPSIRA